MSLEFDRDISVELWDKPVYQVHVPPDDPIRKQAKSEAEKLGDLHGSITNGDGNFSGILAEFVVADVLDCERCNTYERDLIRNGIAIDVKTKRRTVDPKPEYEASISDHNTEQDADVYYFTSVNTESNIVSLCGYLGTDAYYDVSTFYEQGDYDPSNGFEFKSDCYNVEYSKLKQVELR